MKRLRWLLASMRLALWWYRGTHTEGIQWLKKPNLLSEPGVCLYAHYNPKGLVSRYVYESLKAYRQQGFEVLFCSTSGLSQTDSQNLQEICAGVGLRSNQGLDFATWQQCLAEFGFLPGKRMLLTNSSIVGPLIPLSDLFQKKIMVEGKRILGLIESWEHRRHLQSYFLVFPPRVTSSLLWLVFWRLVRTQASKEAVIRAYELNLVDFFGAQFEGIPVFRLHQEKPSNPMQNIFLQLPDFPFVKRSVLARGTPESKWSTLPQSVVEHPLVQSLAKE